MQAPWWRTDRHADRASFLHARAQILRAIRAWFADRGFVEADVGALVFSPGAEVHTQALHTSGGYLHTSPEFALKKLLAAGEQKLVFIGKVYRAGEVGPLHAPEFTMVEWYRANAPYDAVMEDAVDLLRVAMQAAENPGDMRWRERTCNAFATPERITVREAFLRCTGAPEPPDPDAFAAVLATTVEPRLGSPSLTLLDRYPLSEAALAQPCPMDPTTAERFELYACGVELANGYGELTDPAAQRQRLIEAMQDKQHRYGHAWPIDEDFLDAVGHMPPASGCALGLDRLVMPATGARSLADVLWAPPP